MNLIQNIEKIALEDCKYSNLINCWLNSSTKDKKKLMYLINIINKLLKKIFYIIYKFLFLIDFIVHKIIRKHFFYWFREFFEK